MKKLNLLIAFILFCFLSNAQILKSFLPSPAFSDSLGKIVLDFRQNFANIQNEMMPMEANMEVYSSKVKLPGSVECYIYRSHSVKDSTCTFQAVMYQGESYEQASKVYKNIFYLVKKSRIKRFDRLGSVWKGELDNPGSLAFATSTLYMNTTDEDFMNLVAEVELINTYSGWEVHLNIHNKTNDADLLPTDPRS
ncbi:hypothetical protein BH09BAC2_BH09BAC2_18950 [soil metagenome]